MRLPAHIGTQHTMSSSHRYNPPHQDLFCSFQQSLYDLEKQEIAMGKKKQEANSNYRHVEKLHSRLNEDMKSLEKKIKESRRQCAEQISILTGDLFAVEKLYVQGTELVQKHSTIDVNPGRSLLEMEQEIPEILSTVNVGFDTMLDKKKKDLQFEKVFFQLRNEIHECQQQYSSFNSRFVQRSNDKQSALAQRQSISQTILQLRNQIKQQTHSSKLTAQSLKSMNQKQKDENLHLQSLLKQLQEMKTAFESSQQEYHQQICQQSVVDDLRGWVSAQEDSLDSLTAQYDQDQEEDSRQESVLEQCHNTAKELPGELELSSHKLEQLDQILSLQDLKQKNLQMNIGSLKDEIQQIGDRTEHIVHVMEKDRLTLQEYKSTAINLTEQIASAQSVHQEKHHKQQLQEKESRSMQQQKRTLQKQSDTLGEQIVTLEESHHKFERVVRELQKQVDGARVALSNTESEANKTLLHITEDEKEKLKRIGELKEPYHLRQGVKQKEALLKKNASEELEALRKEHAAGFEEATDEVNYKFQDYALEAKHEKERLEQKIALYKQHMKKKQQGLKRKNRSTGLKGTKSFSMPKEKKMRLEEPTAEKRSITVGASGGRNELSVFDF